VPDAPGLAVLMLAALIGSIVGGVAGFGGGLILLPVVAWVVGVRAAAPVLTVTMLLGNLSRIWWSRHELDTRVIVRYLLGAVPATFIGVMLYAGTPSDWLGRIIGLFLIAAIPLRRAMLSSRVEVRLRHFPVLGALVGGLSALVVTTGPFVAPFFLAYGLRRGAFVGTEAVCALGMHVSRSVAFARYSLLGWDTVALGCVLGSTMFAGAWIGRKLLERMSDRIFLVLIEALILVTGLQFVLFSR
jgi:uncharacterized membrane protein YfcA